MIYSKKWTQFETQSLAFGLLRKALYPKYLVRGYEGQIHVYTPTADTTKPVLRLVLIVKASDAAGNEKVDDLTVQGGIPTVQITGGGKAFAAVEIVQQHLE